MHIKTILLPFCCIISLGVCGYTLHKLNTASSTQNLIINGKYRAIGECHASGTSVHQLSESVAHIEIYAQCMCFTERLSDGKRSNWISFDYPFFHVDADKDSAPDEIATAQDKLVERCNQTCSYTCFGIFKSHDMSYLDNEEYWKNK